MDDPNVARLLRNAEVIAVVGLSSNPFRPSYGVAEYLKSVGYRIIPVNPNEVEVLGEKSYPSVTAVPGHIDIVDIFRRPNAVPEVVDAAMQIKAGAIWMQEGIVDEESAKKARAAGIPVVMDRCILKEHRRLLKAQFSLELDAANQLP